MHSKSNFVRTENIRNQLLLYIENANHVPFREEEEKNNLFNVSIF